jgi:peptidyl-prolyl cis-trans isomerase C
MLGFSRLASTSSLGVHMATMNRRRGAWSRATRLLREPTIHFFIIAAAILLTHRLIVGNPRTIVITPALESDLMRQLHDQLGRPPSKAEADTYMQGWKRNEVLYREALREGIDRNDPTVRSVLIGKMRERVMLQAPVPEPTESDLQEYYKRHQAMFDAPFIYEHEYVIFPKNDPGAEQKRAKYERELKGGATPASLGLRSTAAKVDRARIVQTFGDETAERIIHLPIGQWQELEAPNALLLVKMIDIEGGPPRADVLRKRLVAAWKGAMEQKAFDRATKALVARYHFEESSQ